MTWFSHCPSGELKLIVGGQEPNYWTGPYAPNATCKDIDDCTIRYDDGTLPCNQAGGGCDGSRTRSARPLRRPRRRPPRPRAAAAR